MVLHGPAPSRDLCSGSSGSPMKVLIPTPLRSYTKQKEVEATGTTLAELLSDLDRQYPGLRFRVVDEQGNLRRHVRFFVNEQQALHTRCALRPTDAVYIVQAWSGG